MQPLTIGLAFVALVWPAMAAEKTFDFQASHTNAIPAGFRSGVSGSGSPGNWKVILDDAPTAFPSISPKAPARNQRPVLAQLARDPADEHFPLLIYDSEEYGDFTLTTRFKLVAGTVEQMAGVAFRLQDEKNYYYIRASGLGGSFYFFKIVDGVRSAPIGAKVAIPAGVWHEMSIECKGNQIRAWLNGKELIPMLGDKSFTSGKIGFWTKSDAVSYFADTRLVYTPRESLAQALVREAMQRYPRLRKLELYAAVIPSPELKVIASSDPASLGHPAQPEIHDVIARELVHHGKSGGTVTVAMPLHDANGEAVAALKIVMKAFPGQTEKNAIVRALPIVKEMEARIRSAKDLIQ